LVHHVGVVHRVVVAAVGGSSAVGGRRVFALRDHPTVPTLLTALLLVTVRLAALAVLALLAAFGRTAADPTTPAGKGAR
jgi:hypothetical protein